MLLKASTALLLVATILVAPRVLAGERLAAQLHVIGDDSLTQRFAASLESAIRSSPDFSYANGRPHYDIRFLVAGNLYWKRSTQRNELNFNVVVVVTDGQDRFLTISTGPCYESTMDSCSSRVLSDARDAVRAQPNNSFKPNPHRGGA